MILLPFLLPLNLLPFTPTPTHYTILAILLANFYANLDVSYTKLTSTVVPTVGPIPTSFTTASSICIFWLKLFYNLLSKLLLMVTQGTYMIAFLLIHEFHNVNVTESIFLGNEQSVPHILKKSTAVEFSYTKFMLEYIYENGTLEYGYDLSC